jgi:uncharacterized protein YyaL (SSP411 family)
MAAGGVFDHVGGGFHRYSTDEEWLIPHFEKMLYDQAALLQLYVNAYNVYKAPFLKKVSHKIVEYLFEVLSTPDGAFYTAEDADTDLGEGDYYGWTHVELNEVLTQEEILTLGNYFDLPSKGNFESSLIILSLKDSSNFIEAHDRCEKILSKLYNHRKKRKPPPPQNPKHLRQQQQTQCRDKNKWL